MIDRNDIDRLAERVREVMAHWRKPGRTFGPEGMQEVGIALGRNVEVRAPLGLAFDEDDRRILELTEGQQYALHFVMHRRRAAITGPAGSGKTLLAIALARCLGEQGTRTLLTCFNKGLAGWLRRATAGTTNVDAEHFHALCVRLAHEAGLTVPDGGEQPDGSPFFEDDLPDLLERAARALGPRYGAIIVDEAQDFRPHWWPALLALHREPDTGLLYLFADDNQNLYGGAVPEDLVEDRWHLPQNLRTTKAIHEFVTVFYRGDEPVTAGGPPGRDVEVLGYRENEDLVRLLAIVLRNLVEERVPLGEIVVLTPSRRAKSPLRLRGSVDGFRLSESEEPGAVLVSSIHGYKGLERQVVILAEVGDRHREDLD
ncbi:MAG TPA: AAA family ATPase, partial [Actinomycetota bacterium]|nr:AAA family ATPase [Actinomycetota bacterium]